MEGPSRPVFRRTTLTDRHDSKSPDWILLMAILTQTLIGILAVSSAAQSHAERYLDDPYYFLLRHSMSLLIAMVIVVGLVRYWPVAFVRRHIVWALIIPFALLLMTLLPGLSTTIGGANRWLSIGSWNVYVMPIATFLLLFYFSDLLSRHDGDSRLLSRTSLKLALLAAGIWLLTLLQPDVYGGMILLTVLLLMCLLAGLRRFAIAGVLTLGMGIVLFAITQPYRLHRLSAFLAPFEDRSNTGYQLVKSLTALGGGDIWGTGYGHGMVKTLLPGVMDQYLFAVVVEETGAAGALGILLISGLIFFRSMRVCHRLLDDRRIFEGLLVFGLTIWVCLLTILHVAGVAGLIPNVGAPYPLLSYGGSYLLACLASFAVILRLGASSGAETYAGSAPALQSLRKPTVLLPLLAFGIVGYAVVDKSVINAFLDGEYRTIERWYQSRNKTDGDAKRGRILDRFGHVLAKNVPLFDVWIDPQSFDPGEARLGTLCALLELDRPAIVRKAARARASGQAFLYLKRNVNADVGEQVLTLGIGGVFMARTEGRRYPSDLVAAQLVGITDIDGNGLEGIESRFDMELSGSGRPMDVRLSIDKRIQERVFAALSEAAEANGIPTASAIVVRTRSGELLAMASYPAFDPNDRNRLSVTNLRNNAVNYQLEPGLIAAPLTLISAMAASNYDADTTVDTAPGYHAIGNHRISDPTNHGELTLGQILDSNSRVGLAKLALDTPAETLWEVFQDVGFGSATGIELLHEPTGHFDHHANWSEIHRATMAYGHGLLVTPIQIAHAYTIVANDGIARRLTLLEGDGTRKSRDVLADSEVVRRVRHMMEETLEQAEDRVGNATSGGAIHIAAQEALVQKVGPTGYVDRYQGLYAAVAPIDGPELVIVVVVDNPSKQSENAARIARAAGSEMILESLGILRQY